MVLNVNPGYFSIEQAQAQLSSLSFEALIEEDESCLDELENRNIGGIPFRPGMLPAEGR